MNKKTNSDTETWPVIFEYVSGSGWNCGDGKEETVSRQDAEIQAIFCKYWGKATSLKMCVTLREIPNSSHCNDLTSERTLFSQLGSDNLQAWWVSDTLVVSNSRTSAKPFMKGLWSVYALRGLLNIQRTHTQQEVRMLSCTTKQKS